MTLHLIKLSVGTESVAQLAAWQAQEVAQGQELAHITRHMPRRAAELLDGGSIYWVIKGLISARQPLRELRSIDIEGERYCAIIHAAEMIPVTPRPHRPFQGWRYLPPKDAPSDLSNSDSDTMPESMREELARLGLL